MPRLDLSLTGRWLLAGWIAAVALFCGAPSVDLAISGLFWHAGAGFDVITNPLWEWLRQRLWDLALIVLVVAIVAMVRAFAKGRNVCGLPSRAWGFVVTLYLLGPGLIVNGVLKAYSGRARPAFVTEFGGTKLFTPAGQFADQCTRNCSFVSGEVSAAVALAVALWLASVLWSRIERWQRLYLRAVALFIPAFVIVQRVATGRHFASDAVFAALITLTLAWGLYALFAGQLPRRRNAAGAPGGRC